MKKMESKKGAIIGGAVLVVSILLLGGLQLYQHQVVQKTLKQMMITFDEEKKEIEYGSELESMDLIKTYEGGEITQTSKLDTKQVGESVLTFTIENEGIKKELQQRVMVKDTQAPQIKLKSETIECTINQELNMKDNIESVIDVIDGEIAVNNDAITINERATSAFQSSQGKETNQPLIDDFLTSSFTILEEQETKQLYLKDCYYVTGDVDNKKIGEYTIRVVAVDRNGLKTEETFIVTVKDIPKEEPSLSQNKPNNDTTGQDSTLQTNQSQTPAPQPPTTLSPKGLDWMNKYAYSMIGQTGWDCGQFVTHVLKESGYLNPNADGFWSGGIDISWQELKAGDVVYYERANGTRHAVLITSDVFIDHTNGWSVYRWSVVQGGVGSSQAITYGSFDYDPDGNLPNNNYKFIYVKRYI